MKLTRLDALGHLFYLSVFIGSFFIARGMWIGWVWRIIGDLGWIFLGIKLRMSSIVAWEIGFAIIDVFGLIMWWG